MLFARLFNVRQLARLDQADQIVAVHSDPEATLLHEAYAAIDFPLADHMVRLEKVADTARRLRDRARALERLYESESADVQEAMEPLVKWLERLHLRVDLAVAGRKPSARKLATLVSGIKAEDYRDGRGGLGVILISLQDEDLSALGLPTSFLDEGRRIDAKLAKERNEASRVLSRVSQTVLLLREALEEIPALVTELEAARRLASAETGRELPGLELAMLRAAAAPRSRPVATPEPELDDAPPPELDDAPADLDDPLPVLKGL